MTSTSDHTATAWRLFYSNGSGNVTELGLGASGEVLKSNGAAAAPTWGTSGGTGTVTSIATNNGITGGTITSSGTLGLTGQALAFHNLATNGIAVRTGAGTVAGRTLTASGNGISIADGDGVSGNPTISLSIGTGATDIAAGNHTHAQLHNQSHAMTSTSDHTATAWRLFYSNGSGNVTELGLGASGEVLKSNGAAAAPAWGTDNTGSGTVTGSGAATRVAFWSSASALSSNANLYWDNTNSRLGIGTASPSYSIHTTGDIYANGGWMRVSGNNGYYFETHGGGWYMSDATWIRTYNGKSVYQNSGIIRTDGTLQVGASGATLSVPNAGDFAFKTDVIFGDYSTGNVGIGTASPSYKLHVNGRLRTTGINETSDARFKTNVVELQNALEKVLTMRGVNFDWKKNEFPDKNFDEGTQMGLIAQEVEKIIPEVVHTDNEGYKSVEYSKLVALLIEAIKELEQENNSLKSDFNEKINRLTGEIESIKNSLGIEHYGKK